MTAAALLARLTGMGISVTAEGDRLRLRGEERALTPELLAVVQASKPSLLAVLQPAVAPAPAPPPVDRLAVVRAGGIAVADMHEGVDDALIAAAEAEGLALRIDRKSKWGNPYEIGKDGTRDQVCDKFEEYILGRPDLLARLPELRGRLLLCWCHPKRCHGHTLARLAPPPEGQEERLAIEAEGNGEITHAQALQAVEEFDRLVQARDWADWRLEWLAELGAVLLNIRDTTDGDVRQRLFSLADRTPGSAAEWLAIGNTIKSTLAELQREGRLPSLRWPAR